MHITGWAFLEHELHDNNDNDGRTLREFPPVQIDEPQGKKVRLHSATDLDRRTRASREARALATAIETDLGGDLSAIQATLVDRFTALAGWCVSQDVAAAKGEAFDPGQYATVANTLKRIGETLGLERKSRDVSLKDYLAGKSQR